MPQLTLSKLSKAYGKATVVDNLDLGLAQGELVSLLGPSGCGKSTLLKMFAGLEKPSGGRIAWCDESGREATEPGRSMAMVVQEATLMPWARVAANARLPLDLAGVPREQGRYEILAAMGVVLLFVTTAVVLAGMRVLGRDFMLRRT